jgi:serine/threonine-protein kinase
MPIEIAGIREVELLEHLGTGGFGQVWKVCDCETGHLYALKLIQNLLPGSVMVERVRLEAEVLIPSEYVVPAIGLREWTSTTFLILFAYYDGQPLDRLLRQNSLTLEQKRQIFHQMLMGVGDAHRCNIIHRDLKPSNILVGADDQVRIIDFGISKFRGKGLTMSGELMGTPQYIAPEALLTGSAIADARADIFALGHLLYELETGQHFWAEQGWSRLEDFVNYLSQSPRPTEVVVFRNFRSQCYANSREVIRQMLKIDPEERFTCIEEVITALDLPSPVPDLSPANGSGVAPTIIPSRFRMPSPPSHPAPSNSAPSNPALLAALLIVESGSNKDARTLIELSEGEKCSIGRLEIAGNNDSISRQHLEFSRVSCQFRVRDMGSKNGTLLRGTALIPEMGAVPIGHQDRLRVGDVFLRIEFTDREFTETNR